MSDIQLNITDEDKNISQLIARELVYGLNEEDKRLLEDWKNQSERNKALYDYLSDDRNIRDYNDRLKQIHPEHYWKQLEAVIIPQKHTIQWIRSIAAAVVIILVIGGGMICWRLVKTNDETVILGKTDSENTILPGAMKATLILPGGRQIELGKAEEQKETVEGLEIKDDQIIVKEKQASEKKEVEWSKLIIPRGGEYKLVLGDGTVVYINSESRLEFPVEFSDNERVVFLQGEAYFKVARDTSHPFIVKTDQMDVQVLGTEFNVKSYQTEGHVQTTLVQGSVRVATGQDRKQVMNLQPSQQADLNIAQNRLVIKEVDVNSVVAWKNGQFIFKGERLEDIMTALARWYDFEVVYQNDKLRDMVFAGKLNRLESIRPILEIIESTDKINIEVQGKILILNGN